MSLAAFQYFHSLVNWFVIDLHFRGPTTAQGRKLVASALRQIPGCGLGTFDGQGLLRAVANGGGTRDNAVVRTDALMERPFDGSPSVFEFDFQIVLLNAVRNITQ